MVVGDLAELLLIKHHSAVELVDRMVEARLLRRAVDAGDKRRVLVRLTAKGELRLTRVASANFRHLGSTKLKLSKLLKAFRRPPQ